MKLSPGVNYFETNAESEFNKFWKRCSDYDPKLKPFIRDLWMLLYNSPLRSEMTTGAPDYQSPPTPAQP